ncbi:hypothetical protein ABW21_db0207487 [Orbilia brochopaga]|nr:hypothetical protein ABW21_db0207487 [Drechslerella brochopaga]
MKAMTAPARNKGVGNDGNVIGGSRKLLFGPTRHRLLVWITGGAVLLIFIGLGVGLGVGLARQSSNRAQSSSNAASSGDTTTSLLPSQSTSTTVTYDVRPSQTVVPLRWQPTAGDTWQITLIRPPNDTNASVTAFDLDLFDNSPSFIGDLQQKGHRVICYFSAGSYEDWRPDAKRFNEQDYGEKMSDWAGEWWLDTNSQNVRDIIADRIALAQSKGCDAVDPDNINGYQNPTGFNLTEDDAISFLEFMTGEAHGRGMAIGLKNGGAVVPKVVQFMDFCVQESCIAYGECGPYRAFLEYNSPVFHIEYPDESGMTIADICSPSNGAQGFSTIIKHLSLDDWTRYCPS